MSPADFRMALPSRLAVRQCVLRLAVRARQGLRRSMHRHGSSTVQAVISLNASARLGTQKRRAAARHRERRNVEWFADELSLAGSSMSLRAATCRGEPDADGKSEQGRLGRDGSRAGSGP
jgi:hypothetical protein